MADTIDSASTKFGLMTGNPEDSNQATGPMSFISLFWNELSNHERITIGAPLFLLIIVLWHLDKIPEELKSLALFITIGIFIIAWIIVLGLHWRKARNRNYALARERDLIVENWNIRYEQMHELRKIATKIQHDLESLVQEGRLEPRNESLMDIGQLVIEIDKYLDTTNRRVLELEQAEEVVKTPEENQAIVDMLKKRASAETMQESSSNRSASQ